jgi:hypothetical protein
MIGALIVGAIAGEATLAIGRLAFATVGTRPIRAVGLIFTVPSAIAATIRRSGSRISARHSKGGARSLPSRALFLAAGRPARA